MTNFFSILENPKKQIDEQSIDHQLQCYFYYYYIKTQTTTGQIIFKIMWLARKKTKFVDGKEIYGKTFNQSEISSVARFLNFRNDQILLETVKLVGFFGRLLEILPPPPTCQCAAPRPTWSGPAHLPPASLSPKNKTRKVYYFTKEKKKGLLLLTPIFSLISSSSNGYSCYIIFPLVSINGILLPKLF